MGVASAPWPCLIYLPLFGSASDALREGVAFGFCFNLIQRDHFEKTRISLGPFIPVHPGEKNFEFL